MERINNITITDSLFEIIDGYMCHIIYYKYKDSSDITITMSFLDEDAKTMFNRIKAIYKK